MIDAFFPAGSRQPTTPGLAPTPRKLKGGTPSCSVSLPAFFPYLPSSFEQCFPSPARRRKRGVFF